MTSISKILSVEHQVFNFFNNTRTQKLVNDTHTTRRRKEHGFSLLEITVAVGVLLILAMVGLLSYKGLQGNSKQSAVNNAAESVYSKAFSTLSDGQNDTSPEQVEEEYNKSSENITVEVDEISSGRLQVKAFYKQNPAISKTLVTPASSSSEVPEDVGDTPSDSETPMIEDIITTLRMRCDNSEAAILPFMGIQEGAVLTIQEVDKQETLRTVESTSFKEYISAVYSDYGYSDSQIDDALNLVYDIKRPQLEVMELEIEPAEYMSRVSENIEYKSGVEYEVTINGKFNALGINDCVRSVDFAKDSETKELSFGRKITDVSKIIPEGVLSLRSAFSYVEEFNDPDINDWDTSNVKDMSYTFFANKTFNQSIEKWDTGKVVTMESMFNSAESFDKPIGEWNTEKVVTMESMFSGAKKFDQPLNRWDVSSVKNMRSMFIGTLAFNQDISAWDVSNVENMDFIFNTARAFSQDLSKWQVSEISSRPRGFDDLSPQRLRPASEQPQW